MNLYIYQDKDWPNFYWQEELLIRDLARVRNMQGRLIGRLESLGFDLRDEASLGTITNDVIKSSEIEGEILKRDVVRSSIARYLRMDISGLVPSDRNTDGVVKMMLDATQNYRADLDFSRLYSWHSSLFPYKKSGMYNIRVGELRKDTTGPMQVVSGALGKQKVHFQAPGSDMIKKEMAYFLNWFNSEQETDPVIKAGVAHLWFLTIHPFEDGNGRIARALTDMLLARADESRQRFYSLSSSIMENRNAYYTILEKTQKGSLDLSSWLIWFISMLEKSLNDAEITLAKVIYKDEFWRKHYETSLNERQRIMLSRILDGFSGKLTSSKWAKICKTSTDTALRDIQDLIDKNILEKESGGGRSTSYQLAN